MKEILNIENKKKWLNGSFERRPRAYSADPSSTKAKEKLLRNLKAFKTPEHNSTMASMQKSIIKKLNFSKENYNIEEKSQLLSKIMQNRKKKLQMPSLLAIFGGDTHNYPSRKIKNH